MGRGVSGVPLLALLLMCALSAPFVARPALAQSAASPFPSEISKPVAGQQNVDGTSRQLLAGNGSPLSPVGTAQPGNFTWLGSNETRLVVGVDPEKPSAVFELENVAARHRARIVDAVSMGGKISAMVFEILLTETEGFEEDVRVSGLASYVEPSMQVQAQFVPNDPYWSVQWGPQKIGADWAWNTTAGDHSILVAVVDTGIDYSHPDIASNYASLGWNWVNNSTDPMDDHGHGTHCAGIVAAVLNNSIGIAGLAQVRVMAEKVLDAYGWGYDYWVADGIVHATDCGAKIISMSIGGWGDSEVMHDAVKYAYNAGVLLIAAGGNSDSDMKPYPAGYDEVIAVAATDQNDQKAWFSNWGEWIELAAPGVEVYSTVRGGYASMSGTSMSCPHVAGVAALAWSAYSNRTRDWLRMWLRYTADDLGESGFDVNYGYGRVNAQKAVQMSPPAHELVAYEWATPPYLKPGYLATVNATVLNFGGDETNVTVRLLANDTVVDSSTIDFLSGGGSGTVSFAWNPTVEGSCNVTLYVVPVVGEINLANNALCKVIYVGFPVKAVVLHSAGNVIGEIITNWQALTDNWYLFGDKMVYIDYTTLNKEDITYEDIAATGADCLVISCAYDPTAGWQFRDFEIDAITKYVHEGHGLVVTSGTFYYAVPNNNKLAPLFGLNKTVVWGTTGTDLMHLLNSTHPIFANVPNPLVFSLLTTSLPWDGQWDQDELTTGQYLAIGHFQESAIVVCRGLVYISPVLEYIPPYYHHHLQLLYDVLRWSRYEMPEHELTVDLQAPARLRPGESVMLNVTVSNTGLNSETNVSVCLLINDAAVVVETVPLLENGTLHTVEYLWSPSVEGKYNVTASAPPVPNESDPTDNAVTRTVRVDFAGGLVVFEEAHLPAYTIGNNPAADVTGGYFEFANYLTSNGYTVSTIDPGVTITPSVLVPFDVMIIVAPQYGYSTSELDAIQGWVKTGGNLLLIGEWVYWGTQARTIAAKFGISMRGDGICDSDNNAGQPIWPIYTSKNIMPHKVTDGVERIEMYAGDGITSAPADEMPLIKTDSDGTAYWYWDHYPALGVSVASAFEGATTGSGRLILVTDSNIWDSAFDADQDGDIDFYAENNAVFALNCVDWLSTRYEHDLSVALTAPTLLAPGSSAQLNATVLNRGLDNETNVNLQLLVNGTQVDSVTIPELTVGQSCTLSYTWIPVAEGTYNITAYAPPITSEVSTIDNVAAKLVEVRERSRCVLWDEAHGTDGAGYFGIWIGNITGRGYVVETLTEGPVTADVLNGYGVFVIVGPEGSFTQDEISAIEDFVMSGGGLLVTGPGYPWICTSLTSFSGMTWDWGGTSGPTTDITPHPVTQGVAEAEFPYPASQIYIGSPALDLIRDRDGHVMLAASETGSGRVLGVADGSSLMDYYIGSADNLRLANNIIDWLASQSEVGFHDVAVIDLTVSPNDVYYGWVVNASVAVANLGNVTEGFRLSLCCNDTPVMTQYVFNLQPYAILNLSFSWNAASVTPGRNYMMSAVASPVPGETNTANNVFADGTVQVRVFCDTNNDGKVNILDGIVASLAYGTKPSDPRWNRFCDLNQDNIINILDMIILGNNFGNPH